MNVNHTVEGLSLQCMVALIVLKVCKWTGLYTVQYRWKSNLRIQYDKEHYFSLCWLLLQTFSLPCFENLSSKKFLCSIFILMPSFLFSPGLLIDFLIQYLFEWDFQGCSPPTASAGVTLVIISRQWCSITDVIVYWGQLKHYPIKHGQIWGTGISLSQDIQVFIYVLKFQ